MITDEQIKRINELYHKDKEGGGLTAEERREQAELRSAYLQSIRENMRANLERIDIKNPDGTIVSVKERREKKRKESYFEHNN